MDTGAGEGEVACDGGDGVAEQVPAHGDGVGEDGELAAAQREGEGGAAGDACTEAANAAVEGGVVAADGVGEMALGELVGLPERQELAVSPGEAATGFCKH